MKLTEAQRAQREAAIKARWAKAGAREAASRKMKKLNELARKASQQERGR